MEAGSLATTIRGDRALTARSPRSRAIDPVLQWVLSGLAALILVLIAFFFIRLFIEAKPAFDKFAAEGGAEVLKELQGEIAKVRK